MKNLFYTGYSGSQVTEDSFLGRFDFYAEFHKQMADQKTSRGISVIGLNRIGKSSFVQEYIRREYAVRKVSNVILIERTLSNSTSLNIFWHSFAQELHDEWQSCSHLDHDTESKFSSILNASVEVSTWFDSLFLLKIDALLKKLKQANIRLIFVIDEFDYAREIFAKNGGLSLIRDMGTKAAYNVTVITLSRRTLKIIQKEAVGAGSTLSESFLPIYMSHFNDTDMREFYDVFSDYDIYPDCDEALKKRLHYYAGTHPYMLSIYAYRIVEAKLNGIEVNADLLDQMRSVEYSSRLKDYYKVLVDRMNEDGYAEDIRSILCGPHTRVTADDVKTYLQRGYLSVDAEGYYTVSRDFTNYFIKSTQSILLPEWGAIMQAENNLKAMLTCAYPKLNEFTYSTVMSAPTWCNDVMAIYPELNFLPIRSIIEENFRKTWNNYSIEENLVGALTLGSVVDYIILKNWTKFKPYFRNEEQRQWQYHLKLLVRARNPLAHNHPEYLTDTEKRQLPATCALINDLMVPV